MCTGPSKQVILLSFNMTISFIMLGSSIAPQLLCLKGQSKWFQVERKYVLVCFWKQYELPAADMRINLCIVFNVTF